MVVTDDQGRYVIPDLPRAKYKVWVRGYGLVDSPKVDGEPGTTLNLTAVVAPNEAAAAQYYPAIYWYSMLKIPEASQFGGKSDIPDKITQTDWLKQMKNIGCIGCHQLGQLSTRTIPAAFGEFKSGEEAWMRRIQSGQSGEQMTNQLAGNFGGAPFKYLRRLDRPHRQGRAAEGQAAAAAGRRAQHRRHAPGNGRHRKALPARPDRVGSAQSDRQCLRAALRLARIRHRQHADPRSEDQQGDVLQDAGARIRTCRSRSGPDTPPASSRCSRRPTGATRRSGTPAPTTTTPCSTRRAGCGSRQRCAAWTTRPSARRAPTIPRPRCSRSSGRRARWRCSIPRP